ncbi:MAG: GNAT family N-acetyltransferase [Clostridia bacterium]|nr:GNAT family N-acetyltransferase [Clostridia bacterium]
MEITTERLVVKPAGPEYLESTFAYASDPVVTHFMMHLPVASVEEQRERLERAAEEWKAANPHALEFVILMNGWHIGGLTLYIISEDRHEAELAWILGRDYWHKGIAYEAVTALIDYARREWHIHRFIAQCDAENTASEQLMKRLGMHFVSCLGGRKNRSSNEERQELTYEILF